MKVKDIINQFGVDREAFEKFIRQAGINYKESGWSNDIASIDDGVDISTVITNFKQYEMNIENAKALKEKEAADEQRHKKEALANMLITSGFNFDGYTITKYSGYISGDDAISVERGLAVFGTGTNIKDKLMESLVVIRRKALSELKEAAYALGCNAVIGVDFDYLTLDPQTANITGGTTYAPYVFGVTANGNAVIIEKNKT